MWDRDLCIILQRVQGGDSFKKMKKRERKGGHMIVNIKKSDKTGGVCNVSYINCNDDIPMSINKTKCRDETRRPAHLNPL